MTTRNRSSCSRYVGRVGILAVTLGVGLLAMATLTHPLEAVPDPNFRAASTAAITPVATTARTASTNLSPAHVFAQRWIESPRHDGETAHLLAVSTHTVQPASRMTSQPVRDVTSRTVTPGETRPTGDHRRAISTTLTADPGGQLAAAGLAPTPGGDLISSFIGVFIANGDEPGENGGLLIGNGADGGPGQNGGGRRRSGSGAGTTRASE